VGDSRPPRKKSVNKICGSFLFQDITQGNLFFSIYMALSKNGFCRTSWMYPDDSAFLFENKKSLRAVPRKKVFTNAPGNMLMPSPMIGHIGFLLSVSAYRLCAAAVK